MIHLARGAATVFHPMAAGGIDVPTEMLGSCDLLGVFPGFHGDRGAVRLARAQATVP